MSPTVAAVFVCCCLLFCGKMAKYVGKSFVTGLCWDSSHDQKCAAKAPIGLKYATIKFYDNLLRGS